MKPSKLDNDYAATMPLGAGTTATRLALTASTAALTAGKIVVGDRYKIGLSLNSSDAAFVTFAATATLPASDAALADGFWLQPGESEQVKAALNRCAAIMISGTGTLLVTRLM